LNRKTLFKCCLTVGILSSTIFVGSHIQATSNEQKQNVVKTEQQVKGAVTKLENVTREDLAPIPMEKVDKSKVKITNFESKKVNHIVGKPVVNAEKRPGGYAITAYYPTDIGKGELVVFQSVNEYGDVDLLVEEAKTWYPVEKGGYNEISIDGLQAIVHENEINYNTLHIFTENEIFTLAGQNTEYLLEVAQTLVKDIK